ncbi:MAG: transporter substrate-binding domain-containing protein [Chloroflexi bacterium]|nr:transporter substrate-binding domain-containing protein [Chloroflexota bacterium]
MKRKLLFGFLTLVLSLLVTACGAAATPTTAPQAQQPAQPTAAAAKPTEVSKPTQAAASASKYRVGLVTDVGKVNDGTFNQYAYEGMLKAAKDFKLDNAFIETTNQADYTKNVQSLVSEGFNIIVTVGFLFTDASLESAMKNPNVSFIGIDQFFDPAKNPPKNLVGIQFREDQGGFLAGALAGMMTKSKTAGIVAGMEIPPVVKYRKGYENGVKYVCPDCKTLGVYIASFTDPARGKEAALSQKAEGADVIFGAGGPTGSGGILGAAQAGALVIGVDQDEYYTTFGGGKVDGAKNLISSAVKRVDVGAYNMIEAVVQKSSFPGPLYILDAANGGISYSPAHDSNLPKDVMDNLEQIRKDLAAGTLKTGVGAAGEDMPNEMPAPKPFKSGASGSSGTGSAPAAAMPDLKGKTFTVGSDTTYPPFESVDDKKNIVGFDVDMMNEIGKLINAKFQFQTTAFDGIFAALASGKYDVVVSAVTITDERAQTVDFSSPYFQVGQVIAVRSDNSDIKSDKDLKNKAVGVQTGTTGDIAISKVVDDKNIKRYETVDLGFIDLASGKIDAMVADSPTTNNYVKDAQYQGKLKIAGAPFTYEQYGIAIRKGQADLKNAINAALKTLQDNGTLKNLATKWQVES